jgi:hypothetical protein
VRETSILASGVLTAFFVFNHLTVFPSHTPRVSNCSISSAAEPVQSQGGVPLAILRPAVNSSRFGVDHP